MPTSLHIPATSSRAVSPGKRATKSATSNVAAASAASKAVTEPLSPHNCQARQNMIAEAAYFRAEKRGFSAGCELSDWLAAEAEINARLWEE